MTKISLFMNILFLLIAILFDGILSYSSDSRNKQLCYDPKCSEPISYARTTIKYHQGTADSLSFDINVPVVVYSKGTDSGQDFWVVEINGKRGYVSKFMLREYKVLHKELLHKMPTDQLPNVKVQSNSKRTKHDVPPGNKVDTSKHVEKELSSIASSITPSYDVIEGTTIYLDNHKSPVQPNSTAQIIEATAVPSKQNVNDINSGGSSSSGNIELSNSTKGDELPQQNEVNNKNQETHDTSSEMHSNGFLASTEEISDIPEIPGIVSSALNITLDDNKSDNVKHATKNVEENESERKTLDVNTSDESAGNHVEHAKKVIDTTSMKPSPLKAAPTIETKDIKGTVSGDDISNVSTGTPEEKSIDINAKKVLTDDNEKLVTKDKQDAVKINLSDTKYVEGNTPESKTSQSELESKKETSKGNLLEVNNDKGTPSSSVKKESKQVKPATPVENVLVEEKNLETTAPNKLPVNNILEETKIHNAKNEAKKDKTVEETFKDADKLSNDKEDIIPKNDTVEKVIEAQLPEKKLNDLQTEASDTSSSGNVEEKNIRNGIIGMIPLISNYINSNSGDTEESHNVTNEVEEDKKVEGTVKDADNFYNETDISNSSVEKDSKNKKPVTSANNVLDKENILKNDSTDKVLETQLPETILNDLQTEASNISSSGNLEEKNIRNGIINMVPLISNYINSNSGDTEESHNVTNEVEEDKKVEGTVKDADNFNNETDISNSSVEKDSKNIKPVTSADNILVKESILKNDPTDKVLGTQSAETILSELPAEAVNVSSTNNLGQKGIHNDSIDAVFNLSNNDSNTDPVKSNNIIKDLEQDNIKNMKEEVATNLNETVTIDDSELSTTVNTKETNETTVHIDVNSEKVLTYDPNSAEVPIISNEFSQRDDEKSNVDPLDGLSSSQKSIILEDDLNINEFRNRNLLNVENHEADNVVKGEPSPVDKILPEYGDDISNEDKVLYENSNDGDTHVEDVMFKDTLQEVQAPSPEMCTADDECENSNEQHFLYNDEKSEIEENAMMSALKIDHNYWLTLMYLSVSVGATLAFSLGYYYIENMRQDGKLIAKINKLEKDLLVSTKECAMLNENLKLTKDKLNSIEDESFGSNEMVLSLKADLEASQDAKMELEDQVAMLEKDLESATEAGLELERMLREVLSSNNEVNPLAQSVEDLQARLNTQQAANESLTNALNLKTQKNEALAAELISLKKKHEELEVELTNVTKNLKAEIKSKIDLEETLTDKVHRLEMQIKEISTDKAALKKDLKTKEIEMNDLIEVIDQLNYNNLDLNKLYDVSRIKAEATALLEERNELKIRLSEIEGAHHLLEEHMTVVKEEIATLSEQCKIAEKEKKEAETRLEVLSNFFKEKEAQRQKEEAIWLQKQGEVVSTVERIQTMQNEIQNYKQQIEVLKHEILDQEREYKNQISLLETKAHEQWVMSRQVERRLEESKAEAGQLRNRLTLIEKNINDVDSDAKIHRLEANGETATSPPFFVGGESSNSPIMFTGSSGVPPPPPPSYMHSFFPSYLPPPLPATSGVPPYDVGQRPPPLGGRLSSPPPLPLHPPASGRYESAGSPPPPMSPHLLPPFNHHRSPPPPSFGNDHIHPAPPPPHGLILPPPLGTTHSWGEESLPPPRNSGFQPPHREQRVRNHKGSLHSSGESLDKTHHSSKV